MQPQPLEISNRRFIGSKTKLLQKIHQAVEKYYGSKPGVFADLFAGTGTVANYFAHEGYDIIVNDMLLSSVIPFGAWLSDQTYRSEVIEKYLAKYNLLDPQSIEPNYFSTYFGGKYYSENDAKLIGYIREDIEKNKAKFNQREYDILITSLLYTADKIANTVGHFEHYLSKTPQDKGVILRDLKLVDLPVKKTIYNQDANQLVRKINADIVYIDPPYNARQYVNFYHVLENLAAWNKPTEFEGTSMKFKRNHLKSDYSKSKAPEVFADLIAHTKAGLIVVSYNNTYNARSGASNNKIQPEQLVEILHSRGKVFVEKIDYKSFNSGKTNFENHQELLYICKVR